MVFVIEFIRSGRFNVTTAMPGSGRSSVNVSHVVGSVTSSLLLKFGDPR